MIYGTIKSGKLKLIRPSFNITPITSYTNITSGIYFYTISGGDFTDTKKMILLK